VIVKWNRGRHLSEEPENNNRSKSGPEELICKEKEEGKCGKGVGKRESLKGDEFILKPEHPLNRGGKGKNREGGENDVQDRW